MYHDEQPVSALALWPDLEQKLIKKDWAGVYNQIDGYQSPDNRNALYRFAIRKIAFGKWANDYLDVMVDMADRAIALSFAAAREYEEKAIFWKDQANVTCYNVSANLCDCWGDGYTRTDKHFKKGLDLIEKAIELRKELKKPDGPFAMAYWAKGKHLMSLKNFVDAEKNFALALDYEKKLAQKDQKPTQLVEDAPASLLNAAGFLGLAQDRKGMPQGKAMFTSAVSLLELKVKKADSNLKDDIQLFVDQLKVSEKIN